MRSAVAQQVSLSRVSNPDFDEPDHDAVGGVGGALPPAAATSFVPLGDANGSPIPWEFDWVQTIKLTANEANLEHAVGLPRLRPL